MQFLNWPADADRENVLVDFYLSLENITISFELEIKSIGGKIGYRLMHH